MRPPQTVRSAEAFSRTRLSRNFFMRDFLFSEIAAIQGMRNLPANPDLAIQAGRHLCAELLEPLQATFGRIAIRSAYRSAQVNGFGNAHNLSCASNERDRARHVWDERDSGGHMGAMTTIVIPWLLDRLGPTNRLGPMNRLGPTTTWQSIAWWIHDHLPYSELQFFPKLCAFNIAWHEAPKRTINSFVAPRGLLTKPGMANHDGDHSRHYPGFPQLVVPEPFSAT